MIKTYREDFCITEVRPSSDLEEIISNRENKFGETEKYKKAENEIKGLLAKLAELSPEAKGIINELTDAIVHIECIKFSAAYRDGMSDLMTAITLNKLNITSVECFELRKKGQAS